MIQLVLMVASVLWSRSSQVLPRQFQQRFAEQIIKVSPRTGVNSVSWSRTPFFLPGQILEGSGDADDNAVWDAADCGEGGRRSAVAASSFFFLFRTTVNGAAKRG